ncbi:Mss4-like protein [Xylogone sp. PMI_703]|nr:Mss4-like protein [Xylogone sp. PMI_703]
MGPQSGIITVTAECLCKTHTFSTEISTSELPLPGSACHCNSCRHCTGALYMTEVTWPQPREDVDISRLQGYEFSANITYIFCGTCSTLMFYESRKYPTKLGVFSGVLKNIDADLVRLNKHLFVKDTIDGGATISRYEEISGEIPWNWPQVSSLTGFEGKQEQKAIPIWCHCKGIQLLIHSGNYASKKREELPWFIDPRTNKHFASFDVCNSCRLQFGNEIVNWTFVELPNISQANGHAFPKTIAELKAAVDGADPAVGTLGYYQSSPDVQRYFCKVCSASVFYACDDRPEIVDLAIGLLEASDGARAEEFLSWSFGDTPAWVDDANGGWREGLVKRVQADAEEYRIARDYPKSWRRLEREANGGSS